MSDFRVPSPVLDYRQEPLVAVQVARRLDELLVRLVKDGWSGTFANGDGNTVTVSSGIITDVS